MHFVPISQIDLFFNNVELSTSFATFCRPHSPPCPFPLWTLIVTAFTSPASPQTSACWLSLFSARFNLEIFYGGSRFCGRRRYLSIYLYIHLFFILFYLFCQTGNTLALRLTGWRLLWLSGRTPSLEKPQVRHLHQRRRHPTLDSCCTRRTVCGDRSTRKPRWGTISLILMLSVLGTLNVVHVVELSLEQSVPFFISSCRSNQRQFCTFYFTQILESYFALIIIIIIPDSQMKQMAP